MVDNSINPPGGSPPLPTPPSPPISSNQPPTFRDASSGQSSVNWGGMNFTKKQWEQFMSVLCKSLGDQVQQQTKALAEDNPLNKTAQGEDL